MQKISLIGKGFIGKNIKNLLHEDVVNVYDSSNIHESFSKKHELLVCAAPSAKKWLANQNPEHDMKHCHSLLESLKRIDREWIVHFSTVDVYESPDSSSNELSEKFSKSPYGKHRRMIEESLLERGNCTIVRLPAMFGKFLEKNYLFDLIHDNNVSILKAKSSFQWLHVSRILSCIKNYETLPAVLNLVTEPITTAELVEKFFPHQSNLIDYHTEGSYYDVRSLYHENGYFMNKLEVMQDIKELGRS